MEPCIHAYRKALCGSKEARSLAVKQIQIRTVASPDSTMRNLIHTSEAVTDPCGGGIDFIVCEAGESAQLFQLCQSDLDHLSSCHTHWLYKELCGRKPTAQSQ